MVAARAEYRHGAKADIGDAIVGPNDPETQRWWALTDATQEPLPDREPGTWWKALREVFHTD